MDIQFYHHKTGPSRFTACVEVPEREMLENLIRIDTYKNIVIPIGFSFVHPNDKYVKEQGRLLSGDRLVNEFFNLTHVVYKNEHQCTELHLQNESTMVVLELHPNRKRAYLIKVEI